MMTLEERAAKVRQAYVDQATGNLPPGLEAMGSWRTEVMDDAIFVCDDQAMHRVPYTIADDGAVTFGDPQQVEMQLVAVSEALDLSGSAEPAGNEWEATLLKPGLSKNGRYHGPAVLKEAIPLFRGAPVYAFELSPGYRGHLPDRLLASKHDMARNLVGRVTEAWEGADGSIKGRLTVLEGWLREKLMAAWKRGVAGLGLSYDGQINAIHGLVGGKPAQIVLHFTKIDSVDVVTAPAAGGAFERAVAGIGAPQQESEMKELLERLAKLRPDLVAALGENPTPERAAEAIVTALAPAPKILTAQTEEQKALRGLLDEANVTLCSIRLKERVAEAKLPEISAKGIERRFAGRAFEATELEAAITEKKEELDALIKSGQVKTGAADGGARAVEALVETQEKHQAAMDKMLGLKAPDPARAADGIFDPERAERATALAKNIARAYESAPPFRGIQDAFVRMGGDVESLRYTGELRPIQAVHVNGRAVEEYTSGTFSFALGNSLYRRLLNDYGQPDYGEDRIISQKSSAPDFRTREGVRVGYFGDLATVDPETGDYVDIQAQADEEATYSVGQKGNLLTITRKVLLNDDIGVVRRLVSRLGRAARRTHARYVWTPIISNATLYDGVAFFHASHGNLAAAAFSVDNVQARITALRTQTEQGSGELITWSGPFHLWVAKELEFLAKALLEGPATNEKLRQDTTLVGMVMPHIQPLYTSATMWHLTADVTETDLIEMAYLNGQEQPELFLADAPTVGQMFLADKLQYKIRHEYGGVAVEYRGAQRGNA